MPLVPYRITICGLNELPEHRATGISHVLSILDPDWPDTTAFAAYGPHQRVVWRFHDIITEHPEQQAPAPKDIMAILEYGVRHRRIAISHLLVHCHMGISRSTATATILMAQSNPGREVEVFAELARIRPRSWPNSRMIAMADEAMGRRGRLVEALHDHQRWVARTHPDFADLVRRQADRGHEVP